MRDFIRTVQSIFVVGAIAAALLVAPALPANAAGPSGVGAPGCIERNDLVRGRVYLYSNCSRSYYVRAYWNCGSWYQMGTGTTIGPRQSRTLYGPNSNCYFWGLYING